MIKKIWRKVDIIIMYYKILAPPIYVILKDSQHRGVHFAALTGSPAHGFPLQGLLHVRVLLFLCLSKAGQLIGFVHTDHLLHGPQSPFAAKMCVKHDHIS